MILFTTWLFNYTVLYRPCMQHAGYQNIHLIERILVTPNDDGINYPILFLSSQ